MRIIKPEVNEIKQELGLEGIYKAIELAGRTCWKSEDKISENSCFTFFENLKKRSHYSPMEFGTVYLTLPTRDYSLCDFYINNPYSKVYQDSDLTYVTTNMRVIVENNRTADLEFLTAPTIHERRRFFKVVCSRGLSHELVRHRVMSFCQESQRYVNYSKDKYSNEITVIKPLYFEEGSPEYGFWEDGCKYSEYIYMRLIKEGVTPERAREVLPNSTKTEICICGFESDWQHFFELRCAPGAHPQAREIANMIKNIF